MTSAWLNNGAFSTRTPKLQLAIDATSLTAFKRCPRYYELSIIEGYVSRTGALHFEFGKYLHSGREAYLKVRFAGASHDDALDAGLVHILEHIVGEDGALWGPSVGPKRAATLVQAYVTLCDSFAEDALTTLAIAGAPAVELSFRLPTPLAADDEPVELCGHIDRIVRDDHAFVYGLDLKTTTAELTQTYAAKYSPDNQMSLYAWAIPRLVPSDLTFAGMIIEGAQVQVGQTRCARLSITRPRAAIDEWFVELEMWIEEMTRCALRNHWPQRDTACERCTFREVCAASPSVRESLLTASFTRRVWDPTIAR